MQLLFYLCTWEKLLFHYAKRDLYLTLTNIMSRLMFLSMSRLMFLSLYSSVGIFILHQMNKVDKTKSLKKV
jgi:hypothetical protein